ncbi:MAG: MerR family transcriptional regulator [Terriglobales bacterium]
MTGQTYTIGQLAREGEVNVETVRYYHRIGLLPTPARPNGGVRRYSEDLLGRLRFIRRAQHLGFALDEVATLLGFADGTHCAETRALAVQKRALVHRKLSDLEAMERVLDRLIRACGRAQGGCGCPMIEALGTNTTAAS